MAVDDRPRGSDDCRSNNEARRGGVADKRMPPQRGRLERKSAEIAGAEKGAEEGGGPFIYGYLCVFACVIDNRTRVGIGGEVGVGRTKAVGNGGATRTMYV